MTSVAQEIETIINRHNLASPTAVLGRDLYQKIFWHCVRVRLLRGIQNPFSLLLFVVLIYSAIPFWQNFPNRPSAAETLIPVILGIATAVAMQVLNRFPVRFVDIREWILKDAEKPNVARELIGIIDRLKASGAGHLGDSQVKDLPASYFYDCNWYFLSFAGFWEARWGISRQAVTQRILLPTPSRKPTGYLRADEFTNGLSKEMFLALSSKELPLLKAYIRKIHRDGTNRRAVLKAIDIKAFAQAIQEKSENGISTDELVSRIMTEYRPLNVGESTVRKILSGRYGPIQRIFSR